MEDNKRKLYDALSQDYDLGSFEQFSNDIADDTKRRKLFDAASEDYDFGDYDTFSNQLGFGKMAETTTPTTPEPENFSADVQFNDEPDTRPLKRSRREQIARQQEAMRREEEQARSREGKTAQERTSLFNEEARQRDEKYRAAMTERQKAVADAQEKEIEDQRRAKLAEQKQTAEDVQRFGTGNENYSFEEGVAAGREFEKIAPEIEGFNDKLASFNDRYRDLEDQIAQVNSGKLKLSPEEYNRMRARYSEYEKESKALANIAKRYDSVLNTAPGKEYKAISERMETLAHGEKSADSAWEYAQEYAKLQRNPLYRASLGADAPSEDEINAGLLQGQIAYLDEKMKTAKGDEKKELKKAFSDVKESLYANPWYRQHLAAKIDENKADNEVIGAERAAYVQQLRAGYAEQGVDPNYYWQMEKGDKELQMFDAAAHMHDDAIREYEKPTKYDESKGRKNVAKGLGDWASDTDTWSFGIESFIEDIAVVRPVLEKVEKIMGSLDPDLITDSMIDDFEKQLTPGEGAVLDAYFDKIAAVAAKGADTSIGYQIGQGIGDMITLGLEMVATGGAGGAVRGAVEKGSKKALVKFLGKRAYRKVAKNGAGKVALWVTGKVVADVAETAVRIPFMPSTYKALGEGAVQLDEGYHTRDFNEYAPEAAWNQFVEQLTEVSNGFAFPLMGKIVKAPGMQKLFKETIGENGMRALRSFMERGDIKLLDDAMLGSFGGEWEEELLGAVIHSITDDHNALRDFFSAEQQLVLLGTLAPLPLSRGTVGGVQLAVPAANAAYRWNRAEAELKRLGFDEGRIARIKEVMDNGSVPEGAREIMLAMKDAGATNVDAEQTAFNIVENSSGNEAVAGTLDAIDGKAYGELARYFWAAQQKRAAGLMGEIQQDQKIAAKRTELEQNLGGTFTHTLNGEVVVEFGTLSAPDGSTRNIYVTSEEVNSNGELAYVAEDGSKGFVLPDEISQSVVMPVDRYLAGLVMQDAQVQDTQDVLNDAAAVSRFLRQQVEALEEVTYNGQTGTISRASSSDDAAVFVPDEGDNVVVPWEDLASENGIAVPEVVTREEKNEIGANEVTTSFAVQQQIADEFHAAYYGTKMNGAFIDTEDGRMAVIDIIEDTIDPATMTAEFTVRQPDGTRNVTMRTAIAPIIAKLQGRAQPEAAPETEEEKPASAPAEEPKEEATAIPVDKKGNKIYDAPGVSVETALEDLYSTDGLTDEDVDDYIREMAAEAEKGRNPKRGSMSPDAWGQAKKEAARKADFWAQMKEFADENTKAREAEEKEQEKRIADIEKYGVDTNTFDLTPQTMEEAVAEYLGNSEKLIDLDDAIRETLGRRRDNRVPKELFRHVGRGGLLVKNGGRSVQDVANDILGEYEYLNLDQQEVRQAIIDMLLNKTKTEMRETIFDNRLEEARKAADAAEAVPVEEPAPVPEADLAAAPKPVAEPVPEAEPKPEPEPEPEPPVVEPAPAPQSAAPAEPEGEAPSATEGFGAGNTIFTKEARDKARQTILDKLKGQLNAGVDPEMLTAMIQYCGYYIEAGVRAFTDFAKAAIADLGDAIRPYLKSMYNAVRDYPDMGEIAKEMTPYDEVAGIDVNNLDNEVVSEDTGESGIVQIASIDELTDEDFENPSRSVALPELPKNIQDAIGTNGRPVVIKKSIFEKNAENHAELEPEESREILRQALYNTNLYGKSQPVKRPDYMVAIRTGDKNSVVVLDVYAAKDNVEIVGWRRINEKGLERLKRQAEREGGQFLVLSPISDGSAAALSALPSGSSSTEGKGNDNSGKSKENPSESPDNSVTLEGEEEAREKFTDTVANRLIAAIASGEKPFKSITDLRRAAREAGMQVDERGATDILIQELTEVALVRAARKFMSDFNGGLKSRNAFNAICKLYELQPTISMRSSQRVAMQQYSTPLPMSFVAQMFAYDPKMKEVLEPTAGNGMLVFGIPAEKVRANELDETRKANLDKQGFGWVTQQDATEPFGGKYDAVVANPPFGSHEAVQFDGKGISGLDPIITLRALDAMKDDGRAAIIIGGHVEWGDNGAWKTKKAFFSYLYDHYNVKGVVNMGGQLYNKQGTNYPTMMILIDGKRSEADRANGTVYPPVRDKARGIATTNDELYDIVTEIINDNRKTDGNEVVRTERERKPVDRSGQTGSLFLGDDSAESPENGTDGGRGENGGGSVQGPGGNAVRGEDGTGTPVRVRPAGERPRAVRDVPDEEPGEVAERPADSGGEGVPGTLPGGRAGADGREGEGTAVGDAGREQPEPVPGGESAVREPVRIARKIKDKILSYVHHSRARSLESVAPAAMVEDMDAYIQKIEKELGRTVDDFVTEELGYNSTAELHKALAAEQIDSVAMAIYQMKKGKAMIIGDQTGVGKGRQMAALIRWANRQGKKPVFMTQKAGLFSDIYRDLRDIGSGDLKPLILNSATLETDKETGEKHWSDTSGVMLDEDGNLIYQSPGKAALDKIVASGKVPDGYDFVVLTYSQLNNGDQQSRSESKKKVKDGSNPKIFAKAAFVRQIVDDNYVLLDESHTAAGEGSNSGAFLRSVMPSVKGVTFSSATFAKRPDTMPLYAIKSAMSEANVEPNKLIAMIKKGGVTLQEIMSRALTRSGQMVRRERDMSDVKTDWKTVDDPATAKKARANYDRAIEIFNKIIQFQRNFITPVIDDISRDLAEVASSAGETSGTSNFGVDNPPFVSQTYNFTKQLMLALKAEAIVDEVVKEIQAGRHPVIALENTYESGLDAYAVGDKIDDTSFSAGLLRSLGRILQYTVTDPDGNKSQEFLTPEELGPDAARQYYALQDEIKEATKGIFLSPLDLIKERLTGMGYNVGEVTGRKTHVVKEDDGYYRRERVADAKQAVRDFNSGASDVIIINKSGSTGISLHSSVAFKDQRPRSMIIAQPLGDINDYMQMIGRIDRTGQVHRGYYINLSLPVPAELRFNMMLASKLKSLNANTTTSQESDTSSVEAPDFLNKYGSQVVIEYLRDNPDVFSKLVETGMTLGGRQNSVTTSAELETYRAQDEDIQKVTGRIALLPVEEQEKFYADISERYNALIKYLDETGENTLKITTLPLKAKTLARRVGTEGKDPGGNNPFAQNSYVERVEVDVLRKPMKADEIRKVRETLTGGKEFDAYRDEIIARVNEQENTRLAAEEERYNREKEKTQKEIDKQVAALEAKVKNMDEVTRRAEINRITNRLTANLEEKHKTNVSGIKSMHRKLREKFEQFNTDDTYLIYEELEGGNLLEGEPAYSPALFCGFKTAKAGDSVTPSTSIAVFATLDGRRRLEISFTKEDTLDEISNFTNRNYWAASKTTIDNWDSSISNASREERYILTGNILQAWDDATREGILPGRLVSYTDIDGNIKDGIMMNQSWQPNQLRSSGAPINSRTEQILNGEKARSTDGEVEIEHDWGDMFVLSVPKTKKAGAKYFEDKRLLDLIFRHQGFHQYRGRFTATIHRDNMRALLNMLSGMGVRIQTGENENTWEQMDQQKTEQIDDDGVLYRPLEDEQKIAELESGKKVKVYRSMQVIDGQLYPPMSARVEGILREPTEVGAWEESEEHPEMADSDGMFTLDKGNGKSLKAAYAPYVHTRRSPLNEQFSEAYNRPNLVIVEGEIPESELTSGYTAEGSKKSVGEHDWPSGKVSNALAKQGKNTRKVILSRWFKPLRVVPNSEVADIIAGLIGDSDISFPYNVVTPGLRTELQARGIEFEGWQGNRPKNVDELIASMQKELNRDWKPNGWTADDSAALKDAANTKNLFTKQGRPLEYVSTANFFCVFDNPAIFSGEAYGFDEIIPKFVLPISGNEELINSLESGIDNGTFQDTSDVSADIARFRRSARTSRRNSGDAAQKRTGDAGNGPVSLGRKADGTADSGIRPGAGEESSAGGASRDIHSKFGLPRAIVELTNLAKSLGVEFQLDNTLNAKGAFNPSTGRIRINFSAHSSFADLQATLLHEAVAHYGLRKLFGKDWKALRSRLYEQASPEIKEKVDKIAKADGLSRDVAMEEYIAQLAEDGRFDAQEESFWQKIVTALKRLLAKIGINSGYLTDEDFRAMLYASYRNLQTGGALETAARVAAYQALRESADASHEDNGPEDDGPSGNFRKWFKDSKVVDENGRPLVVYHGSRSTQDFNVFDYNADTDKSTGSGEQPAFFFSDEETAGVYKADVKLGTLYEGEGRMVPAYLSIQNPAEIDYEGANFRGVGLLAERYNYLTKEWEPLTNNGLRYFPNEGEIISALRKRWPNRALDLDVDYRFTKVDAKPPIGEFVDGINRDEYDGAIILNIAEVGKVTNDYVAFNSNQIKSAFGNNGDYSSEDPNIYHRDLSDLPEETRDLAIDQEEAELYRRSSQSATVQTAAEMYGNKVRTVGSAINEILVDEYAPINTLMDALATESGQEIRDSERVSDRLREAGGRAMNAIRQYNKKFLRPMWSAVGEFRKKTGSSIADTETYIGLKSGLERNMVFAKRDAKKDYENQYDAAIEKINAEEKQKKSDLDKQLKSGAISDVTYQGALVTLQQEMKDERDAALAVKDSHFADVDAGTDARFQEYRKKDYSAVTAWAGTDDITAAEQAATDYVNDMETRAGVTATKEMWKRINAATKETLRFQYESGILSRQQYRDISGMMDFYVPMRGFAEDTAEDLYNYYVTAQSTAFQPTILSAKGRTTMYEGPLGNIGAMHSSAISQGVKNEAKLSLLDAVRRRKGNTIATVTRAWFVKNGQKDADGKDIYEVAYPQIPEGATISQRESIIDQFEQDMAEKKKQGEAYNAHREVDLRGGVVAFEREAHKNEHVVSVREGGKEYGIIINGNPAAAQAINGVRRGKGSLGQLGVVMRNWTRTLSSMFTTFSIPFWVSNFQRDHGQGLTNAFIRNNPAYVGRYILNRYKAFKLFPYIIGENTLDNAIAKGDKVAILYKQYLENGGPMGQNRIDDNEYFERQMKRYLDDSVKHGIVKGAKSVLDFIGGVGETIETITRFAVFMTSMESGRPIHESISDAKEISTNFARKGSGRSLSKDELDRMVHKNGKKLTPAEKGLVNAFAIVVEWLRATIPFFNAAVQGIENKVTNYREHTAKTILADSLYLMFGLGMRLVLANAGGDDDKEKYSHTSDYLRRNNILNPLGDGKYAKWALPQEYRVMYALGDILGSAIQNDRPIEDLGVDAFGALMQLSPIGAVTDEVVFSPDDKKKAYQTLITNVVPGVAAPVFESIFNMDFKGARIYNEGFNDNLRAYPGWTKALPTTGEEYVAAAKWLNDISGGNDVERGWINLNPAIVEHLVESYLSGPYQIVVRTPEAIAKAVKGEAKTRDIPLWNRILLNTNDNQRDAYYSNMYYFFKEKNTEAQRINSEYKGRKKDGAVADFYNSKDYRYMMVFKKYDKMEKSLRKASKRAVENGDTKMQRDYDERLQEVQYRMAKECLDIYFDRDKVK